MASASGWMAMGVVVLGGMAAPAIAEEGGSAPLADDAALIALAVSLSCAGAPDAVTAEPPPSAAPAQAGPELELVATVRAKTLRFDEVPKVDVIFHGNTRRKTVWKTERVNLPVHPQPGVVYHDVQVRLTITSDVDELATMLRAAKLASRGVRIEPPDAAAAQPAAAPAKVTAPQPPAAPPAQPALRP